MAPRIRARAIRRCGELLREIEPAWASRFQCTEPGGSLARMRSQTARPSMRFIADLGEHGLEPRTTLVESPQSNGMPEAFVRTIKRDYLRVSPRLDAATVMRRLPAWITHYNKIHPAQSSRLSFAP